MKFKDIPLTTTTVELSTGHEVEVRAMTTHDLMLMMGEHAPQLTMAFGHLMKTAKTNGQVTGEDIQAVLATLVMTGPDLMGNLLAMLNDDLTAEGRAVAGKLPIPDQLALLNAAALLTLRSEAHLKKLKEAIAPTVELIYGAMAGMEIPEATKRNSRNGIGAYEGKRPS